MLSVRRSSHLLISRPGLSQRSQMVNLGIAYLRSEEHTSELQSHVNLVCRLLLEKKKMEIFDLCSRVYCRCRKCIYSDLELVASHRTLGNHAACSLCLELFAASHFSM